MLKQAINRIGAKFEIYQNKKANLKKVKYMETAMVNNPVRNKGLKNAVILIHIGESPVPEYAKYCVEQIRLLDSKIPIYFICSKKRTAHNVSKYCEVLCEEDLVPSEEHLRFLKKIVNQKISRFFQVTIERFYILYDAMITIGIENILHLENDNLLYANATELLAKLEKHYTKIATPRAMSKMSCASIMYVPTKKALQDFLNFIIKDSESVYFNDMALLPAHVDAKRGATLPTLTKNYINDNGLITSGGIKAELNEFAGDYYKYSEELGGVFDCAALGQYLDGCDYKLHPDKKAGFISSDCYLDPRKIKLTWIKEKGRIVRPFYIENGKKYLVYNLHIHSKRLQLFMSDREIQFDL